MKSDGLTSELTLIADHLSNSSMYHGVAQHMTHAFAFLRRHDIATLPQGRHEIAGSDAFALIQEYETKAENQVHWEAHRKYIDVQCMCSGVERMGYGHIDSFSVVTAYDEATDVAFFAGRGNDILLTPGSFVVFGPHDVHRPGVWVDKPSVARKVVAKIRIG